MVIARYRSAVAALAAVVASGVLVLAGCSSSPPSPSAAAPVWAGTGYTERVGMPSMTFPATDGRTVTLRDRAAGRPLVLVFGATGSGAVDTFLISLERADREARVDPVVVVATTDPDSEDLARITENLATTSPGTVGLRSTFALTEFAGRSLSLDIAPPGQPAASPQAVGFDADGHAAVAWTLSATAADLLADLTRIDRGSG